MTKIAWKPGTLLYPVPPALVSCGTVEMKKRYGFVYVDADDRGNGTFRRYKKDSFAWMKQVIESNGENLENGME